MEGDSEKMIDEINLESYQEINSSQQGLLLGASPNERMCSTLSTSRYQTTTAASNSGQHNKKRYHLIVIHKWRQKSKPQLIYHLTILSLLLLLSLSLAYLEIKPVDCKLTPSQAESYQPILLDEPKSSPSRENSELLARNKRLTPIVTDGDGSLQQQQRQLHAGSTRQQTIPAASPNFEAAFQGECGKNNNSNPCEHICLDLHDGTYECSCFYGFTLAVDGYSCASIASQPTTSVPTASANTRTHSSSTPTAASSAAKTTVAAAPTTTEVSATSKLPPAADSPEKPRIGLVSSSALPVVGLDQRKKLEATTNGSSKQAAGGFDVYGTLTRRYLHHPQATDSSKNKEAGALILNVGAQANQWQQLHRQGADDNRKFANLAADDDDEELTRDAKFALASKHNEFGGKNERRRIEEAKGGAARSRAAANASDGQQTAVGSAEDDDVEGARPSRIRYSSSSRQRRLLLEPAASREAQTVEVATSSSYALDGPLSELDYRQPTTVLAVTSGRHGQSLPSGQQEQQQQQRQHKRHRHHHHRRHQASEEANIVMFQRSPQMTETSIESGHNKAKFLEISTNNNALAASSGAAGDKRVSYDVETIGARSVAPLTMANFVATNGNAQDELIELSIGNYDDADPDIRSIMMSNDKLVSQLARSVASLANGIVGRKRQGQQNNLTSNKHDREKAILSFASASEDEHEEDYDQSSSMAETLGLLDSLVRKTIDEDYSSSSGVGAQGSHWPRATNSLYAPSLAPSFGLPHETRGLSVVASTRTTNGIDEPFSLAAKPNQSSGNSDSGSNSKIDGRGAQSRTRRSRIGNGQQQLTKMKMKNTKETTVTGLPVFSLQASDSVDSVNMVRLPSNQIDDNNRLCSDADKPLAVFRDCTEMPECESGGQCTVESRWISSKTSDLIQMESRARCRCPIGRGGHLCQKPIQRSMPKFMGHSYLALPMITEPSLRSLRLVFRPKLEMSNRQSTLLLYSWKFLLLLDDMNRVELRYLTQTTMTSIGIDSDNGEHNNGLDFSEVTRVIGSRDAQLGKWNELIITDASTSDSQTNLVAGLNRIVLVTPDKIELAPVLPMGGFQNPLVELFVAGLPEALRNQDSRSNSMGQPISELGEKSLGGFVGCVSELSLNRRVYNFRSDLNGDTLDGFDVGECCWPREYQ